MFTSSLLHYNLSYQKMASLYSAKLVVAARDQLNHELEEKAASDPNIHTSPKSQKHNPYHYHQTVHEKCKHHGEDKEKSHGDETERLHAEDRESILHKKLRGKIEQAHQPDPDHEFQVHVDPRRNYGRLKSEWTELEPEIKNWAKTVAKSLKGEHKLTDQDLQEHYAQLYRWLVFILEVMSSYEGTLRTQTSLHALEDHEGKKSDREIHQKRTSPKIEHLWNESHGLILPPIAKEHHSGINPLEVRVRQLERQLEVSHTQNRELSKKLKDLSTVLAESEQKQHIRMQGIKKSEQNIKVLLEDLEQFSTHLLTDLKDPEKLKQYPKIVQSKLNKIKQFKASLDPSAD